MSQADCEFHVCMGVLRLKLERKSIGIHEIPVPQNQIHIVKQTSLAHVYTEELHEIKYHENLLPTKILNYLVLQISTKFYTLEIFYVYGILQYKTEHFSENSLIIM